MRVAASVHNVRPIARLSAIVLLVVAPAHAQSALGPARSAACLVPGQPAQERPVRVVGDEVLQGGAYLLAQFQEASAF